MMNRRLSTLGVGLSLAGGFVPPAAAASAPEVPGVDQQVQSLAVESRNDAAQFVRWVNATRDDGDLPFLVLDKAQATLFVYDSNGIPLGAAPALIGSTPGDGSAIGIGNRELHHIRPEERTTPAGRFVARMGPAIGKYPEVFWVDYADSVALHPVITSNPRERRMQRLNTPTPDDNRITYGCINVASDFYANVIRPVFGTTSGIAYILPDERQMADVFPGYAPLFVPASDPATYEGR